MTGMHKRARAPVQGAYTCWQMASAPLPLSAASSGSGSTSSEFSSLMKPSASIRSGFKG